MSELIDKAILIGLGLEKKAKETLAELENAGRKDGEAKTAESEGVSPKQSAENKVVDEGIRALKEFLSVVRGAKEKLDKEFVSTSGRVLDKLNVATIEDIEVVKEMARVAREQGDRIEKRLDEIEARLNKG